MGKRKQTYARSPSPERGKRVHVNMGLDEDEVMQVVEEHTASGFPHECIIEEYTEENIDDLKCWATEDMLLLLNYAGIMRDSLEEPEPPPKRVPSGNQKGKKGKAKARVEKEYPKPMPGWEFFIRHPVRRGLSKTIERQLEYINRMKEAWRPSNGNKLEMPEDWFQEETVIVLASKRPWEVEKYNREKVSKTRMSFYTEPISEHLERMPFKTLIRRHLSTRLSQAIKPDWCMQFRPVRPEKPDKREDEPGPSNIELFPTLEHWLDVVNMPMGEHNCEVAFASFFTNIPQTWMILNPKQRWMEGLKYDKSWQRVEFALIKELVRPFTKENVEHERELPISYSHPAMLLAMKGPEQWPDFARKWDQPEHFQTDIWKNWKEKDRLGYCIEDLAAAVHPSLDALVATWFLRVEQQVTPVRRSNYNKLYPIYPPPEEGENVDEFLPNPNDEEPSPDELDYANIPEWAWIPGILYDWKMCYLVAHIPVLPDDPMSEEPVSYVSYLIDEIPMARPPTGDDDDRGCIVERVRLGIAWMCLAKHASKLTSMWDSVLQPMDVMRAEELADFKESRLEFSGRALSEDRELVQPVGLYDRDFSYYYNSEDIERQRCAQMVDIDMLFDIKEDEEFEMGRNNIRAAPVLAQSVKPKVDRWLATLEDWDAEYTLLGPDNDEELPKEYDSEEEYPELEEEKKDDQFMAKELLLWKLQ